MARILCVGSAVLALVFSVPHHPAEDEELRAAALRIAAGGNAANTARVLRALGHEISLGAILADHPAAVPLGEELRAATLRIAAGGNAANTARVLRALGHEVSLGAILARHPAAAPLEQLLWRAKHSEAIRSTDIDPGTVNTVVERMLAEFPPKR